MSRQERRKVEMARRKEIKKAQAKARKELREKEAQGKLKERPQGCASNAKSQIKSITGEQAEGERVAIDYLKTMQRLMPGLLLRLAEVEDFRQPKKIRHPAPRFYIFSHLLLPLRGSFAGNSHARCLSLWS